MSRWSRRRFLAVAGTGAGAGFVAACSRAEAPAFPASTGTPVPERAATPAQTPAPTPPSTPTPIPEPPVISLGVHERRLMEGTEFEAPAYLYSSGRSGPRLMVLGGVHGNEPGGWIAAEEIANWEVPRGMLIVAPKVNHLSAAVFERTLPEYGDLNRLYPGDPGGLPMARMAAEITALATEWRPHWLFDMHESWGFYNERGENSGTAFIGQTVSTGGDSESLAVLTDLVGRVNDQITAREELTVRYRPGGNFGGRGTSRSSSSLSLGRYVPGVTPVLVEMGQQNQAEWRRAELHQLMIREMLTRLEML